MSLVIIGMINENYDPFCIVFKTMKIKEEFFKKNATANASHFIRNWAVSAGISMIYSLNFWRTIQMALSIQCIPMLSILLCFSGLFIRSWKEWGVTKIRCTTCIGSLKKKSLELIFHFISQKIMFLPSHLLFYICVTSCKTWLWPRNFMVAKQNILLNHSAQRDLILHWYKTLWLCTDHSLQAKSKMPVIIGRITNSLVPFCLRKELLTHTPP